MHISFFLIAVISATAIAKPLPDVQTNTPFGYFPSDFGAAGPLFTPLNLLAKKAKKTFYPIPLIQRLFQQMQQIHL